MTSLFIESQWIAQGKEYDIACKDTRSIKPFSRYRVEWEIPAQHRLSWLDQCSDKLGLPARRSGVISDKNAQNLKILSRQERGISGNFGIKHLWGLSRVLSEAIRDREAKGC